MNQITEDVKKIIIQSHDDEYTLEELLAQCQGENPHEEFFAEPVEREEV